MLTSPTSIEKAKLALPGLLAGFFMGLPPLFLALAVLQILDAASGVIASWGTVPLSSDVGRKGAAKKAQMWILVGTVHTICVFGLMPFDAGPHVAGFFCFVEVISILENADRNGVRLPTWLVNALQNSQAKQEAPPSGENK